MKKIVTIPTVLILLIVFTSFAWAKVTVPPRPAENFYVHDYAGMLTSDHIQKMKAIGLAIEKASGAEIVVVTVETLGENTIEDYANELFRSWGIGDKDKHNGTLLLVNKENVLAKRSGRVRVEVGYGLEGAIPDGKAGRILDEYVLPPWEDKDYSRGVYQGFMALAQAVAEEYNLEIDQDEALMELSDYSVAEESEDLPLGIILFIVIMIAIAVLNNRGGGGRGRGYRPFGPPYSTGPFFNSSVGRGGFGRGGGFGGFGGGSSGGGGASR